LPPPKQQDGCLKGRDGTLIGGLPSTSQLP
jgi:hypothetical protein